MDIVQACSRRRADIGEVRRLLNEGADPNEGLAPAAGHRNAELVELLLGSGATPPEAPEHPNVLRLTDDRYLLRGDQAFFTEWAQLLRRTDRARGDIQFVNYFGDDISEDLVHALANAQRLLVVDGLELACVRAAASFLTYRVPGTEPDPRIAALAEELGRLTD